jgi:hypothetical protein
VCHSRPPPRPRRFKDLLDNPIMGADQDTGKTGDGMILGSGRDTSGGVVKLLADEGFRGSLGLELGGGCGAVVRRLGSVW